MKTLALLLAIVLAVVTGHRKASASAYVALDRKMYVDGLVRRDNSLPAGGTIVVATTNCNDSPGQVEDTYLYLIQYSSSSSGTLLTYNDDWNGTYCSRASYTNTTTHPIVVSTLLVAYAAQSRGYVDLTTTVNGSTTSELNVYMAGYRISGNWSAGTRYRTIPQRFGALGDGPRGFGDEDTLIVGICKSNNAVAINDDSGIGGHADLTLSAQCNLADLVVGGYYDGMAGSITLWRQDTSDADLDGDGIPGAIESYYGTSDSNKDSDSDGLTDDVEFIGKAASNFNNYYDGAAIMPYEGAHPSYQDLFIEIDYMASSSHTHSPIEGLASDFEAIFNSESQWSGRAIRTHLVVSQNIGHYDGISFSHCASGDPTRLNFYDIKSNPNFFDPVKLSIYHYVIAAHSQYTGSACSLNSNGGKAEVLGNDVIISLADLETQEAQRQTYVHEIGHNLELVHNGNADDSDNPNKNNYGCVHTSVMNYGYHHGWGDTNIPQSRRYSYSRGNCEGSTSVTPVGGTCANTCVNKCVPAGQLTPKGACGAAGTHGPWVSDGTCDCDRPEWTKVNLKFQSDSEASDAPASDTSPDSVDPYLRGDGNGLRLQDWAFAERKRAHLLRDGVREGTDYVTEPRNGKMYVSN